MGSRYDLAEAAAAVELGRRHPYLTLLIKRLPPFLVAVVVAAVVWALAAVDWHRFAPTFGLGWLWVGLGALIAVAALAWAGKRWGSDVAWRLRVRARRY